MSNTNRFDGKGEIYAKARPKYAEKLFDYLTTALPLGKDCTVADIGSGTGIFTGQLLGHGVLVYAVEPNDDMREKAEEKLSAQDSFISVKGTADNTSLPDSSVDYVTAAQAFHWFDSDAFKKECQRIVKPGGKIIIIYNSRDTEAPCTQELAKLRGKYNPEFHGFSNGISDEACRGFFGNECDVFKCENNIVYDRQGYIERVLSSSYSLNENDEKYPDYISDINSLFDRFESNGTITVPNFTIAYIGEVK